MFSPFSISTTATLLLLLCISMATSNHQNHLHENTSCFLQCLISHSQSSSHPISNQIYTPNNSSYTSILESYIRNLRFISNQTLKPLFIVTPTHESHIQSTILCSKSHSLQIRIRSGGHDYDGLSYKADMPFVLIDMSSLRSVEIDLETETAWVQSGATIGELYHKIAEKSEDLGFPAGVCPTVGVGGHFSGGGYGNMMRKYGLTVDNVIDAYIVNVNGEILNRELMGDDLFWAIRGGGGASFGIILSWKIKLVSVPKTVTVFRIEKTLQQGATDLVHQWQYVADKIDENLFIRLVLLPVVRKTEPHTIKAKFNALFLGNAETLVHVMNQSFSQFGLELKDCVEVSWIKSVLFWYNYPNGTLTDVLLDRKGGVEKFLKKKSDYVQEPITKQGLELIWKKMIELKKPALTFNPYGGKMDEISETATPFPHRKGNIFKIQYSINWKDDDDEVAEYSINAIRSLYEYMTPYVSKSPRSAYLNYRDVDLGTNGNGDSHWGYQYFKGNFERLVYVKNLVDPDNFFRYEQSIPPNVSTPLKSGLSVLKSPGWFRLK